MTQSLTGSRHAVPHGVQRESLARHDAPATACLSNTGTDMHTARLCLRHQSLQDGM